MRGKMGIERQTVQYAQIAAAASRLVAAGKVPSVTEIMEATGYNIPATEKCLERWRRSLETGGGPLDENLSPADSKGRLPAVYDARDFAGLADACDSLKKQRDILLKSVNVFRDKITRVVEENDCLRKRQRESGFEIRMSVIKSRDEADGMHALDRRDTFTSSERDVLLEQIAYLTELNGDLSNRIGQLCDKIGRERRTSEKYRLEYESVWDNVLRICRKSESWLKEVEGNIAAIEVYSKKVRQLQSLVAQEENCRITAETRTSELQKDLAKVYEQINKLMARDTGLTDMSAAAKTG